MEQAQQRLRSLLASHSAFFCVYTIIAACSCYAFMYGFRKPIAVGLYQHDTVFELSLKALYIAVQLIGYALSKFIGIKVISELQSHGRGNAILLLVVVAWLALLGFALTPAPWNGVFLLINGLPLGMIWGIVFSYLEGRRVTEILAAGLSISFILASGMAKTAGGFVLQLSWINEFWMPFVTATLFLPFLACSVWMLEQIPPPNAGDIAARNKRSAMTKHDRRQLLSELGLGLFLLIFGYVLLTIIRDLRDSFSADVWLETGQISTPWLFTLTEIPIALVVLGLVALLKFVHNNQTALVVNHLLILCGFIIVLVVSWLYQQQLVSSITWMIVNGVGLYLAYVPFTSSLFERLVATFDRPANVGFLTYLADSFGYLGTLGVMVYQSMFAPKAGWSVFLTELSLVTGAVGVLLTIAALSFFMYETQLKSGKALSQVVT